MEENKNTKIHNEELVQVTAKEEHLRDVADDARESATRFENAAKTKFLIAIHKVVDAVIRGEIVSVSISRYKESPTFYIYNNEKVTSTAYDISDVADVIDEALAVRKEETEEAYNG